MRAILLLLLMPAAVNASSTISTNNSFAYGANVGWMDWRGDETNGCGGCTNGGVIGEFVVKGFIYAANVGWINLGNGNPTNGIQYTNLSTNDFGVNNLGTGELRGFAYGANVGWLVFTNRSAAGPLLSTEVPHFDLATGRFSGFVWSANCGWISLSNAFASVKTDSIRPGADLNGNGLADAWELQNFGFLGVDPNADADGDGMSNLQEYQAGTNPNDRNDSLRVTAVSADTVGSNTTLTWTSNPSRLYQIEERLDLNSGDWSTNLTLGVVVPDPGVTTTRNLTESSVTKRFFRVQAVRPLSP
jgi:hypothetical protein